MPKPMPNYFQVYARRFVLLFSEKHLRETTRCILSLDNTALRRKTTVVCCSLIWCNRRPRLERAALCWSVISWAQTQVYKRCRWLLIDRWLLRLIWRVVCDRSKNAVYSIKRPSVDTASAVSALRFKQTRALEQRLFSCDTRMMATQDGASQQIVPITERNHRPIFARETISSNALRLCAVFVISFTNSLLCYVGIIYNEVNYSLARTPPCTRYSTRFSSGRASSARMEWFLHFELTYEFGTF